MEIKSRYSKSASMKKTKRIWVWIAMIFQFLTAAVHSIGFFVNVPPANPTEAELMKLMSTYRMDLGRGFHPTTENLFLSMSGCFTLLCLFGGLLNLYLLRKMIVGELLKHILFIQVFIYGCCFVAMCFLTFLLPIASTGLIFASLVVAWGTMRKE